MGDVDDDRSRPGLVTRAGLGLLKMVLGFAAGVALVFGGFFLLVWGESRVNIATAIDRATDATEEEASDGTAVTYTGGLAFAEPARDPILDGEYAYVDRRAQTCAWTRKESKGKKGGSATELEKAWVDEVPDSKDLGDSGLKNEPPAIPDAVSVARGLRVGPYSVSQVTQYLGAEAIAPDPSQIAKAVRVEGTYAYTGSETSCAKANIGDQRITFRTLRPGDVVTVFGRKQGDAIQPFRGQVILSRGSREDMVERMRSDRASRTWIFRAAGGIVLWIALYLVLGPVLSLVTWVPLVGGLVRSAATVVTMLAALALTGAFVFLGWGMTFFTNLFGGWVG